VRADRQGARRADRARVPRPRVGLDLQPRRRPLPAEGARARAVPGRRALRPAAARERVGRRGPARDRAASGRGPARARGRGRAAARGGAGGREPLHRPFVRRARAKPWALAVCDGLAGRRASRLATLTAGIALARALRERWRAEPRVGVLLPPSVAGAVANL